MIKFLLGVLVGHLTSPMIDELLKKAEQEAKQDQPTTAGD